MGFYSGKYGDNNPKDGRKNKGIAKQRRQTLREEAEDRNKNANVQTRLCGHKHGFRAAFLCDHLSEIDPMVITPEERLLMAIFGK